MAGATSSAQARRSRGLIPDQARTKKSEKLKAYADLFIFHLYCLVQVHDFQWALSIISLCPRGFAVKNAQIGMLDGPFRKNTPECWQAILYTLHDTPYLAYIN